jgi:hypothetical protein
VGLEALGKWKEMGLTRARNRSLDLPACSMAPQGTTLPRAPAPPPPVPTGQEAVFEREQTAHASDRTATGRLSSAGGRSFMLEHKAIILRRKRSADKIPPLISRLHVSPKKCAVTARGGGILDEALSGGVSA